MQEIFPKIVVCAGCCALAIQVSGCGDPPSEIVLAVEAPAFMTRQISGLRVTATLDSNAMGIATASIASSGAMDIASSQVFTLGITAPITQPNTAIQIDITGSGVRGNRLTKSFRTAFVSQETRAIVIALAQGCLDVGPTCPNQTACGVQGCEPVDLPPSSLLPWNGGDLPTPRGESEDAVVQLAAGGYHTCVRRASGRVVCWGDDTHGQLGRAGRASNPRAVSPVEGVSDAFTLDLGRYHTCIGHADGRVSCFGQNQFGQLGFTDNNPRSAPESVPGLEDVLEIAAGANHTCVLRRDGTVLCFGSNTLGQRGQDSVTSATNPVLLPPVQRIASGDAHTCVITGDAHLYCWGDNSRGQLARNIGGFDHQPQRVEGLSDVVDLDLGGNFTCAQVRGGSTFCFGDNASSELGNGSSRATSMPSPVIGLQNESIAISLGSEHACARTRSSLFCWGNNVEGQVGDNGSEDRDRATRVLLDELVFQVAAGGYHTCARTQSGWIFCWGQNESSQVGDQGTLPVLQPKRVAGL